MATAVVVFAVEHISYWHFLCFFYSTLWIIQLVCFFFFCFLFLLLLFVSWLVCWICKFLFSVRFLWLRREWISMFLFLFFLFYKFSVWVFFIFFTPFLVALQVFGLLLVIPFCLHWKCMVFFCLFVHSFFHLFVRSFVLFYSIRFGSIQFSLVVLSWVEFRVAKEIFHKHFQQIQFQKFCCFVFIEQFLFFFSFYFVFFASISFALISFAYYLKNKKIKIKRSVCLQNKLLNK